MHSFVRDADDAIDWIQEKDVVVSSDNYGTDRESTQALIDKHDGFEVSAKDVARFLPTTHTTCGDTVDFKLCMFSEHNHLGCKSSFSCLR